jgi:hypothetical protein
MAAVTQRISEFGPKPSGKQWAGPKSARVAECNAHERPLEAMDPLSSEFFD